MREIIRVLWFSWSKFFMLSKINNYNSSSVELTFAYTKINMENHILSLEKHYLYPIATSFSTNLIFIFSIYKPWCLKCVGLEIKWNNRTDFGTHTSIHKWTFHHNLKSHCIWQRPSKKTNYVSPTIKWVLNFTLYPWLSISIGFVL